MSNIKSILECFKIFTFYDRICTLKIKSLLEILLLVLTSRVQPSWLVSQNSRLELDSSKTVRAFYEPEPSRTKTQPKNQGSSLMELSRIDSIFFVFIFLINKGSTRLPKKRQLSAAFIKPFPSFFFSLKASEPQLASHMG